LPTKCRPSQVTDWIKSKKKDVAPLVDLGSYGDQFMKWWRMMQPSWRIPKEGDLLVCKAPIDGNWQVLRKGGTSGIYTVVMGLSWWIKAQGIAHDVNAWTTVSDLLWVIKEMKKV
jgi:hypothetical protein